jgi:hypothetical protein
MTKKSIFGIFYQIIILGKYFRQNYLKRLSAFCQNAVFGNMSVHPKFESSHLDEEYF